jgi:hypothetical protein
MATRRINSPFRPANNPSLKERAPVPSKDGTRVITAAYVPADYMVLHGLPGSVRSTVRPDTLSHLAPRTSHLAPRGAARLRRRSLHLGVSRGRPWCPPSLLRQSSAFRIGRPLTRPCIYLAYGRSTCAELASRVDTKASRDDTVEWKESRCVVPSSAPAARRTPERCGSGRGHPVAEHPLALVPACRPTTLLRCFGSTHANLGARESLRCPPSRRVPHKWSGRRPNRYMAA